jgi:hypothetical protein
MVRKEILALVIMVVASLLPALVQAGSVVGQFPGTYMNIFQVSLIWESAAKG